MRCGYLAICGFLAGLVLIGCSREVPADDTIWAELNLLEHLNNPNDDETNNLRIVKQVSAYGMRAFPWGYLIQILTNISGQDFWNDFVAWREWYETEWKPKHGEGK
jgi:hypothetical protein